MQACLREIHEETDLCIDKSTFRLIAIIRDAENLGIQLLTKVKTLEFYQDREIKGNEEWENGKLNWITFEELNNLNELHILEGLYFLKDKNKQNG